MKGLVPALLAGLFFADIAGAKEWSMVSAQEFEYTGLPDTSSWGYEEGFVRNREMQYYTRARKENAWVADGVLTITARREEWGNSSYQAGSDDWRRGREFAQYTSAALITRHKASWRYGRIEVRAKLPRGEGVWPAIWMLGSNRDDLRWPSCGEIDIMEFLGRKPNTIYGTVHYGLDGSHVSSGGTIEDQAPSDAFHIYAIEWDARKIDFFFDDELYHSFEIDQAGTGEDNPFRKPFYLLINLALGGSWGGKIDDDIFPQEFVIDYLRVYKAVGDPK